LQIFTILRSHQNKNNEVYLAYSTLGRYKNVYTVDVRESVHHTTIHKEKSNKIQQCIKLFIIPYLYEAHYVSGNTPPIIRSLKLHWKPLVFHMWKVDGRVVCGP